MDILDEELLNLWRLLQKYNTHYIMVGGFAATFHGFNRATADLDMDKRYIRYLNGSL